jgi:hypothetical protein
LIRCADRETIQAMPRYRIVIEGSGLEVPGAFAGAPSETIRGFFVARVVNAPTRAAAEKRALSAIATEWSSGLYADLKVRPHLRVSESRAATLFEWLRPKRTGYAFHPGHS